VSILDLFGAREGRRNGPRDAAETQTVRRIVRALERLEPDRARFIAAFAYVLGRVAHVDRSVSEKETRVMEEIVERLGDLDAAQAILVVQMAKSQNALFGGTENYLVTREFNKPATWQQKLALLECLFALSASDAPISVIEDNEIRRIASELRLTHRDFIQARSLFREHLAVLRRPAGHRR
jgi:uncharacterized tellurite resistance protein B-like protein